MPKMRIRRPVQNVIYTFRFPGKGLMKYRWYGETVKNDRLLLFNITNNYYTPMTAAYFSFLLRNRFVKKESVTADVEPPKAPATAEPVRRLTEKAPTVSKPSPPSEDEQDKIKPLENEIRGWVLEKIQKLKNATTEERRALSFRYPYKKEYTINGLVSQFEYALEHGISDRAFGVLINRYSAMSEVMLKARAEQCQSSK